MNDDCGRAAVPLSPQEFSEKLGRLGPFETKPKIAVACSGGPDSLTLLALCQSWTEKVSGELVALIVDHRLRDDSTLEARRVADRIRTQGIEAVILARDGRRPDSNIQEFARNARYRLLLAWCRAHGVLHLVVGHHQDDQAETVRLRLERGSGSDGLAAMAPILELPQVRVLRPLLDVPKTRIRRTLEGMELEAVQDPSNDDLRFDRVRVRKSLTSAMERDRLVRMATENAAARRCREAEWMCHLAGSAEFHPEGYARVDPLAWKRMPLGSGRRALSSLCMTIGGRRQPPRRRKTERLYEAIIGGGLGGGRTLAGCRIVPHRGAILFLREEALIGQTPGTAEDGLWDGRFRFSEFAASREFELRKLGQDGISQLRRLAPDISMAHLPPPVRPTIPAVWGLEGVYEVPHLSYSMHWQRTGQRLVKGIQFAPSRPLQATRFTF